jgi:hypothetical protein
MIDVMCSSKEGGRIIENAEIMDRDVIGKREEREIEHELLG